MADENRIEFISVDKLQFDIENPRLPSNIAERKDQAAVLEWMLDNENIIELMGSISERGYFFGEPLLVVEKPKDSGFYEVVEGNRRLAAVKLLRNPELAPRKPSVKAVSDDTKNPPKELPVIEFKSRSEILTYLGYRHITGVQAWDSLAKARYLRQLFNKTPGQNTEERYKILAKSIGSRSNYVQRLLTGLAVYEEISKKEFFEIKGLDEEEISFSVLTTALNYNNIAEFLELDDSHYPILKVDLPKLRELTTWMFEKNAEGKTRLGESRNLKYLSAVVNNDKAKAAFRLGEPLEQASMLTEVPAEIFRTAIIGAKKRLQVAREYSHKVDDPTDADAEMLQDIQTIARDLRKLVIDRLNKDEKD